MANKLFYTYIHGTDYKNDSFVPSKMIYSYWDSLIFDVNHRTIWHQGMPFGNVYPGTLSYGEIFNDLQNNIALGAYSHAEGYSTYAKSNYSHAEGYKTFVDGVNGHVEGNSSYSLGENSHAEGSFSYSNGENSHAEGNKAESQGRNSHAEGFLTYAIGEDSHAEGNNTYAKAKGSHSEGNHTIVNGENSHAEGYNTIISAKNSHAEGQGTIIEDNAENSHTEGLNTRTRSKNSHAEGQGTLTTGENSHAEGYYTTASGYSSHTEGSYNYANAENSHAEGAYTYAIGKISHAEGAYSCAFGTYSHAEGYNAYAYANNSHSEGYYNTIDIQSNSSHIEGSYNNISFSESSHVEGGYNINSGSNYSHVEGSYNQNHNTNSHVEGKNTYNFGKESHVEGTDNITYAYTSHIEGYANTIGKTPGDTKYIHAGGNNNTVYPNSENIVIYGNSNKAKGVCSDINGKLINGYANYSVLRGSSLAINSGNIEDSKNGIDFVNVSGDNITVGENATYGFAHGSHITLQSPYEVGFGRYTKSYLEGQNQDKQNTIFIIGNGNDNEPSNALDVRENGISYLYKGIYTWDYVEDYPYSIGADNPSSYYITQRQLAQVATVTYVMRNSTGRRNFYPLIDDPEHPGSLKPKFTGAEYFNNYGDETTAPNNAYADFCHAEGWGTSCNTGATYSHAEGCGTETRNPGEHASGNWNSSSENTLFSVGWGTSNVNRANAFEIKNAPTSDGIAFVDKKPIVTSILNGTGPTYLWKGEYSDYIKINQVDQNTLYFIYDGDASTRNDFISIDQMDDIVNRKVEEKIKQYTQGMLYNANYSPKFNGHGGDSNFSYVWTGNTTDFKGLGDLSNDSNTVFIIRNNK